MLFLTLSVHPPRERYKEALKTFGVHIDPASPLCTHNVAVQQIVEIARAVQRNARVLILDEPTSAIGEREREQLMRVVRTLRDQGVGIVLVSHKLEEVFALSDRVTVLKDGRLVGTVNTADTSRDEVVRMMVGRELSHLYPARSTTVPKPLFEIRNLSGPGFSKVNLIVRSVEIFGLFGLTGSGRSELTRAIFGARKHTSGQVFLNENPQHFGSTWQAMQAGIAYITEDRKLDGLFMSTSVRRNIAAVCLKVLSGLFFMNRSKENHMSRESIDGKYALSWYGPRPTSRAWPGRPATCRGQNTGRSPEVSIVNATSGGNPALTRFRASWSGMSILEASSAAAAPS